MSNTCTKAIAANIEEVCASPINVGIRDKSYLINFDDVDSYTISGNMVTALTLKSSAHAYYVINRGKQPYNGTTTEMTEGNSKNSFTHTSAIIVPDNSPAVAEDVIDQLANGKFVHIYRNDYANAAGDNAWQIHGLERGLRASAITGDKYAEDTDGGWAVTLVEEKSNRSATFLWATSGTGTATAATTEAYLEAMLPTNTATE